VNAQFFDSTFQHHWQAEILPARPIILPTRHFVYPRNAEEIERGALEVLVHPIAEQVGGTVSESSPLASDFLATCALGFRDPAVPTGLWSCPDPDEICAVSGGYAYIINTAAPECFTMIAFRPVLEIRPAPSQNLLLFVGHHAILAWGSDGQAWQSEKLSSEGLTVGAIEGQNINGIGWDMMTDKETLFAIDLRTGMRLHPPQ
jgi:hypothetical protein